MLSTTLFALATFVSLSSAAPFLQTRQKANNVNVAKGSTPVIASANGTFNVNIQNFEQNGNFALSITDKTFALTVACLNDATIKCKRIDTACKDKIRKACIKANKIGSVVARLNADEPTAATKVNKATEVLLNNISGKPIVTGGPPKELGAGTTGAVDDSKGTFSSSVDTPIRALALQVGCLIDESNCVSGNVDPAASVFGFTGDCVKDRIACQDASGLSGLSVKMNND